MSEASQPGSHSPPSVTAASHPVNQEVQSITKEVNFKVLSVMALDTIIGYNAYQSLATDQWSQQAVETITTNLVKLNKPYKYVVTCVIMQTGAGAGLSVSSTCYWDKTSDRMCCFVGYL
ncbi:unnamed protein product [Anisakis simplex]|uniref:Dynein light chain Tctex-type 3 (inferred by orthology to a human protein) n=1 Tax=Anisakis simplex TaxID=6269 RepID=A0A0M3JTD6_ANISI|nr:unnamed protein product [Anisakis simplex]